MPLIKGFSRPSISKNIATEIRHGKDPRQAAAIAYSTARKAKRMWSGGMAGYDEGGEVPMSSRLEELFKRKMALPSTKVELELEPMEAEDDHDDYLKEMYDDEETNESEQYDKPSKDDLLRRLFMRRITR